MPQENESGFALLQATLHKIQRYYAIVQSSSKREPVLLEERFEPEMLLIDLTTKMEAVEQAIQQFLTFVSNNPSCYKRPRKGALNQHNKTYPQWERLNYLASGLYDDLVLASQNGDKRDTVDEIHRIAMEFEERLGYLSDQLYSLNASSSAFSLARFADGLADAYEAAYEKRYNRYGCFSFGMLYALKKRVRTSTRLEEIEFLSTHISSHPACNDRIRFDSFFVMTQAIDECKAKNSILRDLLINAQYCCVLPESQDIPSYQVLSDFCSKHLIKIPTPLSFYINHQMEIPEENRLLMN